MSHRELQRESKEFIQENNRRILSAIPVQERLSPDASGSVRVEAVKPPNNTGTTLSPDEFTMLTDIYNRFDVSSTQRARDLGLSAGSASRIYKRIEKMQFVEPISVNLTGRKGGLAKFHLLTEKGYRAIRKEPHPKYSGRKGAMHIFLQRYLKRHLPEVGFKEVKPEKEISGKRIDVFCKYNHLNIAIEICISTLKTEHINVLKGLERCDLVIVVCTDRKLKKKLEDTLKTKVQEKERFIVCYVHELLDKDCVERLFQNF